MFTVHQETTRSPRCKNWMKYLWTSMSRRKPIELETIPQEETVRLRRVFNLADLTLLGIGSTLGVGIYIIAGKEAHDKAGPGVVLSLIFAAAASILAGMTYAELASRVETAGSAYMYSYVACGEFPAYVIGWNIVLEYAIGTASVASAFVRYVDGIADRKIISFMKELAPMDVAFLAPYADFASFIIVTLTNGLLALGARTSSWFTNICTLLNVANIIIMCTGASILAKPHNWELSKEEIPEDAGKGGFLPYGFEGVTRATGTCFFAYVGFDSISATGEEAKNPRRNVPLAIFLTLASVCVAYTLVSTLFTMAAPYYEADVDTPFPTLFHNAGWTEMRWIVTTGAIFALATSLIGVAFPLPRVLYAMAKDGMFFRFFSRVHSRTGIPLWATVLASFTSSVMALLFNLDQLMDMMSIGTLMAYMVVGVCVVQIRYRCDDIDSNQTSDEADQNRWSCKSIVGAIFNLTKEKNPTKVTSTVVTVCQVLFLITTTPLLLALGWLYPSNSSTSLLIICGVSSAIPISLIIIIFLQPTNIPGSKIFKVPLVPFFPYLSVTTNLYFMVTLDPSTWVRFLVWNMAGLLIYFLYNLQHSSLNSRYPVNISQNDAGDERSKDLTEKKPTELVPRKK